VVYNNLFSIFFFLDKKETKNQAGSKWEFFLLGDFRRRTGPRNSRYGTGLYAGFFMRVIMS